MLQTVADADRQKYVKLNQQQQIIESILQDEGADLTKSKKEWIKKELDKLVEEKKKN